MDRSIFLAGALALWCSNVTAAHAAQEPVATSDIVIARCTEQASEFGLEQLRSCIRQDLAAVDALNAYPPEARPRIDACILKHLPKGWTMVHDCVKAGDPPPDR